MKTSIEISMYPLTPDYEAPILNFIKRLHTHPNLRIETNSMSTQVFGNYDDIMNAVQQAMKTSLEQGDTTVMVMKVLRIQDKKQ